MESVGKLTGTAMSEAQGNHTDDNPGPKPGADGTRNFFSELRDRKVYHTAVIYVAAAWAIIQFADIAGPRLGIPDGAIDVLLWILIVGFPIVIVLSWVFEIRSHGWPSFPVRITQFLSSIRFVALWIVGFSLAIVLAALFIGGVPRSSFAINPKESVVVGHYQNYTSDSLLDDSLGLAFRVGLEQSRHAIVIPHSQIRHTLSQMRLKPDAIVDRDLGIRVAVRLGARALIIGSVGEIGTRYKITAEVLDPGSGRTVLLEIATVDGQEAILAALDRQTRELRAKLGESIANISHSTLQLERVTTANLDALKAYSLALQAAASGNTEDAVMLLDRAISLDPEFAMAHAKIATLYEIPLEDLRRAAEHRNSALQYIGRLTERERIYIEASHTATGKPEEMLRAWRLMRTLYPEDPVGYHNLAHVYWRYENKFPEAVENLAESVKINNPWLNISYHNLGYAHLGSGDYDKALENFELAWNEEAYPVDGGLAHAYVVLGQYQKAEEFLTQARQTPGEQMQFEIDKRWVAYFIDQGRLEEATSIAEAATRRARSMGKLGPEYRGVAAQLAIMERSHNPSAFADALQNLIDSEMKVLGTDELEIGFSPVTHLALLGKISARNGKWQQAQRILDAIRPQAQDSGYFFREAFVQVLAGEIELAQGRAEEAIEFFRSTGTDRPLFQLHESLARGYEQAGDIQAAIEEHQWIVDHRGLPFAELVTQFFGIEFSILDWAVSLFHLGRLNEHIGNQGRARANYQKFLMQWSGADDAHPLVALAGERIVALGEQDQTQPTPPEPR